MKYLQNRNELKIWKDNHGIYLKPVRVPKVCSYKKSTMQRHNTVFTVDLPTDA